MALHDPLYVLGVYYMMRNAMKHLINGWPNGQAIRQVAVTNVRSCHQKDPFMALHDPLYVCYVLFVAQCNEASHKN